MTYRGLVKAGVVVLDDLVSLPEGTEVDVSPVKTPPPLTSARETETVADQLADLIGSVSDLPKDMAANHDLHGGCRNME